MYASFLAHSARVNIASCGSLKSHGQLKVDRFSFYGLNLIIRTFLIENTPQQFVNGFHGISAALYRLLLLTGLDSRVCLTSAYFTHGAVTYLIQGI